MSRPRTVGRRIADRAAHLAWTAFAAWIRLHPHSAPTLARGLGLLWYGLDGRHRRLALNNLQCALGSETSADERERIALSSFRHLTQMAVELVLADTFDRDRLEEQFVFTDEENLLNALAQGRGAIAISAHLGNFELLSGHCLRHGRGHIVVKRIHNPHMDRLVRQRRHASGLIQIDATSSVREILAALRANEPVAFLCDQTAPAGMSLPTDFFGRPAWTVTGPAVIALKIGCPVFLFLTFRRPDGRHEIVYGPPLDLVRTGDREKDIAANTQRFTSEIEAWIRRFPEQWLWVHDRWRPRGDPIKSSPHEDEADSRTPGEEMST